MRRHSWLLVPLLITLGGCGRTEWTPYAFEDGLLFVEFPGDPQAERQTEKTSVGPVTLDAWTVTRNGVTYVLRYGDLPPKVPLDLRDFARASAVSHDGRVIKETPVTLEGQPGLAFELETRNPAGVGVGRLYQLKNHLYQLLVLGPQVRANSPEVQKYFASFHRVDKLMR